jgi:S-adenosyl methyltransferase
LAAETEDGEEKPTAENQDWPPHGIDTAVPNVARVYDYWLGGAHNFAADRAMADKVQQAVPGAQDGARINRAFLRRAILPDGNPTGQAETVKLYQKTSDQVHLRSHEEVLSLFTGFELVEPGLVGSAFWRTSSPGDTSGNAEMNTVSYGGVGRKP